jgi:hypothetical protein
MNAIRRTAVLIGLTVAVIVGSSIPASATFTDSSTPAAASFAAVTVAPPTGVTLNGTWCERGSFQSWNGYGWTTTYTLTLRAKLSWQASGTRGVIGYRITGNVSGYPMELGVVPVTSVAQDFELYRGSVPAPLSGNISLKASVTTLTSYGWTSVTRESGVFTC